MPRTHVSLLGATGACHINVIEPSNLRLCFRAANAKGGGRYAADRNSGSGAGAMREAAEAEVSAAAYREHWAKCLAHDAACLPFGMVGELRRKLSPITTLVLLLFMGVGMMNIRVSAEFPSSRQRAAFARKSSQKSGR